MKIIGNSLDIHNVDISTKLKTKYINTLLIVGFDTIKLFSFEKNKIIQMKYIENIIKNLYLNDSNTNILSMVDSINNAKKVLNFNEINKIGINFYLSETHMKLNFNSNLDSYINKIYEIIELLSNKKIVIYLDMCFGNPYNEEFDIDNLLDYIDIFINSDIDEINIVDSMGLSTKENIELCFNSVFEEFDNSKFGFCLYSKEKEWYNLINTSYKSGVKTFESSINGLNHSNIKGYEKIKILKTKNLLDFFYDNDIETNIDIDWLKKSKKMSDEIFK